MLALNFHKTFISERRLIASLLEYAALGRKGDLHQISEETGIPMGRHTGKTPAILDYCIGMGLVSVEIEKGIRRPILTPFGGTVFLNDGMLTKKLTQWLVHLNLCRSDIGAVAWNKVFVDATEILGSEFTTEQLEEYLVSHFGKSRRSRTGPLLSVYNDDAAFARARIIQLNGNRVTRNKAPVVSRWAKAYSALVLELFEAFFPDEYQVTITDFSHATGLFKMCCWSDMDQEVIFMNVERTGFLAIDRQIRPWIIEKRTSSALVWPHIYTNIV